jgi:hypothetical protein
MLFNGVWEFFKARLASDASEAVSEYAIPTTTESSSYETALTAALLERLHAFCEDRGIGLIIIDIPRLSGDSSLPPELESRVGELSDFYVDASELLADYLGAAELHRPGGNQHITEFTHVILGTAAAKAIEARLASAEGSRPHP